MTTSERLSTTTGTVIQEVFAQVAQELVVVIIFAVSFVLWGRLRKSGKPSGKQFKKQKEFHAAADVAAPTLEKQAARCQAPSANSTSPLGTAALQTSAAEQTMLKQLEQREFTRALNIYRSFERNGRDVHFSEELFALFIQSAVRVGKIDVAERMLHTVKRSGKLPGLAFWQSTLRMLSSRKHFKTSMSVYVLFGERLPADRIVFSCLINAALEAGAVEKAVEMLPRYEQCELEPKDYVLCFRTFVATGDIDRAEALFRKLGTDANTLMLNLLLLTCVNGKGTAAVPKEKRARDLLQHALELEKSSQTKGKIVDVVSYNTMLKGLSQANMPGKCIECLQEMMENGIEPDDITFGTLLDACITGKETAAANKIVDLFMGAEKKMDTVVYTLFIKGLVQAQCIEKALELYDKMKTCQDAHPDVVTFSVLIKALVDNHDLDNALRLLEDMKAANVQPDDIILTHLLEGCRHTANHALGKKLFADILTNGIKPSEYTLVTMLKLHGRCGAHKEAHELVQSWASKYGFKPSVIHYTCLMSGCLRTKSYDQAWSAYELMQESGVALDSTALSTLLPGMVTAQRWDSVLVLARLALANRAIRAPPEALNLALVQMVSAGAQSAQTMRMADELRALMQGAGVPITARNVRRLAA